MTVEIPNVTITSGSTVLAGSTISTFGTLEIDGSMNTPATGQISQENGANIQRFNDRVYVGGTATWAFNPGASAWLPSTAYALNVKVYNAQMLMSASKLSRLLMERPSGPTFKAARSVAR